MNASESPGYLPGPAPREPELPFGDQPAVPAAPPERSPVWDSLDVFFMAAVTLPALAAGMLLAWVLFQVAPVPRLGRAVQVLAAQFLFWGLWLLALYGLLRGRYGRPFWRSLAWFKPPRGLWASAGLGVLTALGVIVAGAMLRPPRIEMPLMELLRDPASVLLVGSFAVTLGPLCEELAFRGFLLPWLIRVISAGPAILITALLFAALHGPEYAWSWQHVALITAAGAAFGWVRYRSGSTAAATVMHAAYNLVFFLALLAQTGQLKR